MNDRDDHPGFRCARSDMDHFHFDVSSFPQAVARQQVSLEVDNKPFKFILPFEVKVFQCYSTSACIDKSFIAFIIHVKIFSCNKFLWVSLPAKTF